MVSPQNRQNQPWAHVVTKAPHLRHGAVPAPHPLAEPCPRAPLLVIGVGFDGNAGRWSLCCTAFPFWPRRRALVVAPPPPGGPLHQCCLNSIVEGTHLRCMSQLWCFMPNARTTCYVLTHECGHVRPHPKASNPSSAFARSVSGAALASCLACAASRFCAICLGLHCG